MDDPVELQSAPDSEARLALLSLPDWTKLLRHFELGQGFALIVILLGDSSLAPICRDELDLWLLARQRPRITAVPIDGPDDLTNLPEKLLLIEPAPEGPVWVDGTGPRDQYESAWTRAAVKLNLTRNTIVDHFSTPLILVAPTWVREILRDTAPDFWSIRTFVAEILIPGSSPVPMEHWPREAGNPSEFAPNPDFILRQAEALRGRPDQDGQLSRLLDRAGRELMNRGRYEEARAILRQALELNEAAVRQQPEHADYLHALAVAYGQFGTLMADLRASDEARKFYDKAVQILARLLDQEPDSADYLSNLSVAYNLTGDLSLGLGHHDEADPLYRKALAIREQLVRDQPYRADYLRDLGATYQRLGDRMWRGGRTNEAQQFYAKFLDIAERLMRQEPGRADYLDDLLISYLKMGYVLEQLGAADEARRFFQKAHSVAELLVRHHPTRVDYLQRLIATLSRIGSPEQLQEARSKLEQLTQQPTSTVPE